MLEKELREASKAKIKLVYVCYSVSDYLLYCIGAYVHVCVFYVILT